MVTRNHLTDANIGVTVQAHDAVLDATTASFTTADETKLDGIEASADVTDATNVAAAGAFMKATDDLDDTTEGTTNKHFTATEKTKLAGIATGANNYSHPNHSGEVTSTGDGATVVASTAVSNKTLKSSLAGTEEVLINDAGTLKKTTAQDIADLGGGGGGTVAESTLFTSNGGWVSEVEAYVLAENLGYDLEAELKQYQFNGALKPLWIDVNGSSAYVRVDADASFPYGYSVANQALFEKYSGRGVMPFISESLGNSGAVYDMVSNSSGLRDTFIAAVVADCVALGWRGVAVDIEGFGSWTVGTTNHFYDFLTDFSAAMKAAGKITSVYIPPIWNTAANTESGSGDEWDSANSSSYYELDYASLNAITDVDFWEIPMYDYEFDYGSERPEAPLQWIADVVSFAKSQFDDINKIVIGVSGQGHFGADGYADFNNWTYVQAAANGDFDTATRDAESGELYWKPSTINYWIADDETQNIRRRLLESLGIRHMSIWYLGDNKYGSQVIQSPTTIDGATVLTKRTLRTNPAVDTVNIFARDIANRMFPAYAGPGGLDSALQPLLARNKVGYWNPPGNATTVPGVFGFTAPTVTGFTAAARNVATTNMFTRMRRLGYNTAATAGAVGQWRVAAYQYTLGNGSGLGGFTYIIRFGISDATDVTDARMFIGMRSSSTPSNVEPSTLTNCIGVGHGASDTNLKIFYGGSSAQTPIDLGANFPNTHGSVDVYELALFSSNMIANTVNWQVTRLNTGDTATGTITGAATVIPQSTTLIAPWGYRTNNATAAAVSLDVMSAYIETDQ